MHKIINLLILILLLLMFAAYLNFRLDDTFIFYSYAKNIAEGNGYVFNVGEKVNATTSPLYTLLLAFLYLVSEPFLNGNFVILGNLISILSIVLIFYFIRKMIADETMLQWFAMIFLAMPLIKFAFGMETFLNLAIITSSTYFFTIKKYNHAFLIAALAVLARIDSILFAIILYSFYTYKNKSFPKIKFIIIFCGTLAPWFIFSKLYFDSFLPTTISSKLTQSNLGIFGPGLIFLTESVRVIPGTYFSVIAILLVLIFSIVYLYQNKINIFTNPGFSILLTWMLLLFIIYAFIINAMPYQWYYTPYAVALSIIFSTVASSIVKTKSYKELALVLLFLIACILPLKDLMAGYNPKYINFTNAAKWLNEHVADGSIIGTDDVGILGYYYKKGKIVDALGLITPEVSEHLSQHDFNWFINRFKPAYIVNEYPNVQKHVKGDNNMFWQTYDVVKVFESHGEKIGIYKRR